MLNKMMIGRYYPVNSLVHKMNPFAKILCTLLFVIMIFFANDLKTNVVIFILLALMLFNTKIPINIYLKSILGIKWLLLFIIIINLICGVSFEVSLINVLRIIYIVLYTSILTLTTPPSEITYGLEVLFSPLKLFRVPVNKMALSITLALRFIPTIIDQGNKILKSQASRGVDYYNSNIKIKILAIKTLIIPMFSLSIKRADDLADSMEVRLYNINKKRTNFRQNKFRLYDLFILMVHIAILVLAVKGVLV